MITALVIVVCVVGGWMLVLRSPQTGRLARLTRGGASGGGSGTVGGSGWVGGSDPDSVGGPDSASRAGPSPAAAASRAGPSSGVAASRSPRSSRVDDLAFDLDLVAVCLQAGLPVERALDHTVRASGDRSGLGHLARAARWGVDDMRLDGARDGGEDDGAPDLASVVAVMRFSGRTGVALAPLLQAHADELRRSEHRRRQIAAARLGVMLVLPLGVCVLPAFVLLGVVPVLLTLIGDLAPAFSGL